MQGSIKDLILAILVQLAAANLMGAAWAEPNPKATEQDFQNCACAEMNMEIDLDSGARADCSDDFYAIEVESYEDWAEGIGQSLHYADQLGLKPKIIFFCEGDQAACGREKLRAESTIANHQLPIDIAEVELDPCYVRSLSD